MEQFTQSPSSGEGVAAEDPSLSTDELNVMHYAGGYAPHSLLKRYMKREYDQFIECLGDMAVESGRSNILSYTKEWIEK